MNNKSNRIAFASVVVLALVAIGLIAYPLLFPSEYLEALITVEGYDPTVINLSEAKDEVIHLNEKYPVHITVEVENHRIRFIESDCPDKICIQSGYLGNDLDMAACIPNKTAIFIQNNKK